ncbi:MAG: trypsin-like peptidase domain-containing protein [Leptolyngbyaceae cyanobacterium MO_188.B28]|nr:trypsin-like peptidase domain-containing protein [Leptolyngbyaceae cyanobacterium MO_188.B28]
MSCKFLIQTTSGVLAVGAAIGLNAFSAIISIDLLEPNSWRQKHSQSAWAQDVDEEISIRVYQQASPAVVTIEAGNGSGSGSIITSNGLVLTNAHVLGGVRTVTVRLADGRQFQGDVVGYGERGLDLAAVQIRGGTREFPTIRIAPPGTVRVGQRAFAIGNPFGLQGTFTVGIVSRIDLNRGLIQTDAAINPGNSGGPLLNRNGELVGVNTSIFTTGQNAGNIGIGFAIATDEARPFITSVQRGTAAQVATGTSPNRSGRPPEALTIDGPIRTGRLDENSNVLPLDNSFFNLYTFEGQAGQQIAIEMVSNEIDSYLIVLTPDSNDLGHDNNGAGGQNARLVATLPSTGIYLVVANSYSTGELGSYQIQVTNLARRRQTPQAPIEFILQEQGSLGPGDTILSDYSFFDSYTFSGKAGQQVTISLQSPDFDPYLFLVDEAGNLLAENNDVNESDYNSKIVFTLPLDGSYEVIANSADPAEQGFYTLMIY